MSVTLAVLVLCLPIAFHFGLVYMGQVLQWTLLAVPVVQLSKQVIGQSEMEFVTLPSWVERICVLVHT